MARLVHADHGQIGVTDIVGTGLYDPERARETPLWARELHGFDTHVPETEEYGVTSFVHRARQPCDPAHVHAVLTDALPGVIRAKGHFWIATRPDWVAAYGLAGAQAAITPLDAALVGVDTVFLPALHAAQPDPFLVWRRANWGLAIAVGGAAVVSRLDPAGQAGRGRSFEQPLPGRRPDRVARTLRELDRLQARCLAHNAPMVWGAACPVRNVLRS